MRQMGKQVIVICLLILCATLGFSQDNYYNAIGIRGGNPAGVTYKQFIGRYGVVEVIGGITYSYSDPEQLGFTVTGLYEYHFYLTEQLNFFAGGGLSVGFGRGFAILNFDAIGGLDYTISNFPINLSVDYKPYYSTLNRQIGYKGIGFDGFGVSVRYIIQ